MRSRLVTVAVLSLGLALTACSGDSQSNPTASITNSPTAMPSETNSNVGPWTIYYVGDTALGPKLYAETSNPGMTNSAPDADPALTALRFLVAQGSSPTDTDYTNLWGNGTTINSISYSGDKAVVDLTISPLNVGASFEMSAIDQLVWTLTENHSGISSVEFTSGNQPIETFAGHVDATQSFKREPNYEVLAPIWIDEPAQALSNPVTMTGTACTFEAAFGWELKLNDEVVQSGSGMAAMACPDRSPWKVELETLEPGTYTFIATDYSAEDGSVTQQDSKEFTVK